MDTTLLIQILNGVINMALFTWIISIMNSTIKNKDAKVEYLNLKLDDYDQNKKKEIDRIKLEHDIQIKELTEQVNKFKQIKTREIDFERLVFQQCIKMVYSDDLSDRINGINMLIGIDSNLTIDLLIECLFDDVTMVRITSQKIVQSISNNHGIDIVGLILKKNKSASHEVWFDLISFLKKISKLEDYKRIKMRFDEFSLGDPILKKHFDDNF